LSPARRAPVGGAATGHSGGRPRRLQRHLSQSLGSELGAESSFIAVSTSRKASSPSYLFFSERKFWAFAQSQCLFKRIFVGNLAGLRAFSVLAEVASGPRR